MAQSPVRGQCDGRVQLGETLAQHINALLQQERPLQEIIIVDNASTDGTSSLLAACYPQVTVLYVPENLGTGGALTAGLSYVARARLGIRFRPDD